MCKSQCLIFPNNCTSLLGGHCHLEPEARHPLLALASDVLTNDECCILIYTPTKSLSPNPSRSFVLNFELSIVKVLLMYAALLFKALRLGTS